MSLEDWSLIVGLMVGTITITLAMRPILRWIWKAGAQVKTFILETHRSNLLVVAELSPNGGTSLKDRIQRIDKRTQRSYATVRAIFGSLATPGFETDSDGRFVSVNRQFELLTGYPERDLLDMGWVSIIHPRDVEQFMEHWIQAIRQKRIVRLTCCVLTQAGNEVRVCVDANPLRIETPEGPAVLGWLGTFERDDEAAA